MSAPPPPAFLNPLLTIRTANSAYPGGVMPGRGSGAAAMSIGDLPVLSALRTRMQWHQERQRVLAENVANSDTPNFKPRDLIEPKFDVTGANASGGPLPMVRTSTSHISPSGAPENFDQNSKVGFETRPAGNAV